MQTEDPILKIETTGAETCILKDIRLEIFRGEKIAVFGPENSGIDQLVRAVLYLDRGFPGRVYFMGVSVNDFDYMSLMNYRSRLGYVQREFGLISNMSVTENIALPVQYHTGMEPDDVSKLVDRIIREEGLDHCRDSRPIDLAPSEVLKTAYARAIALDPEILIMEWTFGDISPVDMVGLAERVAGWLSNADKTAIFITHRPEKFIDFMQRFIMLNRGRIVFDGGREDFINSGDPLIAGYRNIGVSGPMKMI
ncbi:MAG: ATP-binding cassette domain-containing protein [Spirochaetes bacterium]|jgi:phospholipid/cholesterol/gamma-HCH transport system ATP-binding protein|nr:ATP-binding cassette domain-containing protein [Spirochaetota bacterium]